MVKVAFKDVDGDLLHISHVFHRETYLDVPNKYHNTYCFEIEMVTTTANPAIYFNAEQLRSLANILTVAAEHLEDQEKA